MARRIRNADLSETLLAAVRGTPGQSTPDLAAAAGEPIQPVRDALSALEAAGTVRREGKTRATRWFAVGGAAPKKAAEPAAAGKPGKPAKAPKGEPRKRPTPKADALERLRDELGTVPDRVIAERIGVSAEMVRLFRRQHGIPGIQDRGGPLPPRARRAAPAAEQPAKAAQPAQPAPKAAPPAPKAAPSAPKAAAPPAPTRAAPTTGGSAWRVALRNGQFRIVLGADIAQAAAIAAQRLGDAVIGIEWMEQVLEG